MDARPVRTAVSLAVLAATCLTLGARAPEAGADPPTGGTVIDDETFTGATVPDAAWQPNGATCLTGAPAGSTPPVGAAPIPNCGGQRTGPVPALGAQPGYLQLTDSRGFSAGNILYQRPIPASAGISVVFEQYQYGGNEADGIGFFLVDGATPATQVGGDGGSLGYAQRNTTPGVPGGVIGVGLDVYGNYYDDGESRGLNCPPGQRSPSVSNGRIAPGAITVRGPGNGLNGYCYLASTTTGDPQHPTSTLPGTLGAPPGTTDPAAARRLVNVRITPAPAPRVIVEMDFLTGAGWQQVLDIPAPAALPRTYKFGFTASTGGNTDVHLLRNVVVRTIEPLGNLQLVKQVSRAGTPLPPVITPGTVIPYEFVVTNGGLETVTGLTIADPRVTGAVCDATTLPPQPAPGGTTVCRANYTVTPEDAAAGQIVNTAVANALDVAGAPLASNQSTVTVPLVSSISVVKRVVSPPPYAVGQQVTYGYTVTNTGGSTLRQVSVADNRIAAGGIVCPVTSLDPGATTDCTGTAVVTAGGVAPDGTLTNTAVASGVTPLGQVVTSPPSIAVIPVAADIGVTKVVDQAAPVVGTNVTFTVTAANGGPSPSAGIVVTDQVPPGLTYISSTVTGGTYDPVTGAWSIPNLAVGQAVTLTLTARVDTASAVTNGATVTTALLPDPNTTNNSASVVVNPVTPTTDIAVTKTVDQASIRVGQQATFTVTARNLGPFAATGILVTDPLPSRLTFVSASGTGTYDPATARWTVGDLAVGAQATLTLVALASDVGQVTNAAGLLAVSPTDINQLNDSDSAPLEITPRSADLSVTKNVSPAAANVGDEVTYTFTAGNNGPDDAPAVVVRDISSPALSGLTIVSATASQGTFDAPNGVWTVGALPAQGTPATLTVVARVDAARTQGNSVVVEDQTVVDPDPTNNVDNATLTASLAPLDIAVTKTVAAPTIDLGAQTSFTVTATNAGPTAATGVVLQDPLPPGLALVTSSGDGAYDASGTWTIGPLAVGATATLTITVEARQVGQWVNAASLFIVDQRDTDPSNDLASASVTVVEQADLVITKSVAPDIAAPGDVVVYTVTITNDGPNDAADIEAVDPQQLAATFVGVTVTQGTFDEPSRLWDVGALASGDSATLTAQVLVTRFGRTVNTVRITQSSVPDPDLDNNVAQATLTVPSADLAVTKVVDQPTPTVGEVVTFTVTAQHLGPDPATGVTVTDAVPAGLTFVDAVPSTGTYDAVTGVWTIGDASPGDVATLVVRATATTPGVTTNTAVVAGTGPPDPDPTNNQAAVGVDVRPETADVAVTKTVDPGAAVTGGAVEYTIVVTNLGPGAAEGVTVVDPLPGGVSATGVQGTGCALDAGRVTCSVGGLAVGASSTVLVQATVTASGTTENVVTVTSTTLDPVSANDSAAATVIAADPPGGGGSPGAGPGTDGGTGSGGGTRSGTLPFTGADVGRLLTAAGLLVGAGAALHRVGRRRHRPAHAAGRAGTPRS